jgi:hypothetical protein
MNDFDYQPHELSGTLLHDTPEHPPVFGQWVCSCGSCLSAVRASIELGTTYIVKAEMGRAELSAKTLARHMHDGTLDAQCQYDGLGLVREVFVAEPSTRVRVVA